MNAPYRNETTTEPAAKQLEYIRTKARLFFLRRPDYSPSTFGPFDPTNTGHFLRPEAVV